MLRQEVKIIFCIKYFISVVHPGHMRCPRSWSVRGSRLVVQRIKQVIGLIFLGFQHLASTPAAFFHASIVHWPCLHQSNKTLIHICHSRCNTASCHGLCNMPSSYTCHDRCNIPSTNAALQTGVTCPAVALGAERIFC